LRPLKLPAFRCVVAAALILPFDMALARESVDPIAVEALVDRIYAPAIEEKSLAGAVVTIIQDGKIVVQKGYGTADRNGRPLDPVLTPVRSGSINKVMTAIAIMQLVERRQLSLDDPLDRHLKRVKIPQPKGKVTLRHLLTHSAGFGDRWRGNLVADPTSEKTNAAEMLHLAPAQLRAPGQFSDYSNFHAALLAAVVEDVTGLTYRQYVTRNILQPLAMRDSFFEVKGYLPLDRIAREQSIEPDGRIVERPFYYKAPFYLGSGGLFWTAADMGRFMDALILGANGQATPLLTPASFRQMFRPQTANTPFTSIGLAFHLDDYRPRFGKGDNATPAMIGHNGSTGTFRGFMMIVPEQRIGIFIEQIGGCSWPSDWRAFFKDCASAPNGNAVIRNVLDQMIGKAPIPRSTPTPPATDQFVGSYVAMRAVFSRDAVLSMFDDRSAGMQLDVAATGPGLIYVTQNGSGKLYRAVSSTVFVSDDLSSLRFVKAQGGKDVVLFGHARAAERVPAWMTPRTLLLTLVSALILLLSLAWFPWPAALPRLGKWSGRATSALAAMSALFPAYDALILKNYYRLANSNYNFWSLLAYGFGIGIVIFALSWAKQVRVPTLEVSTMGITSLRCALFLFTSIIIAAIFLRFGLFAFDA
jgi:CubicO group peptidase (beta-lactamase class C family)